MLRPLTMDFVPNGRGSFTAEHRARLVSQIQSQVLKRLAESQIPVFIQAEKNGDVSLDKAHSPKKDALRQLLLPPTASKGVPEITELGTPYALDFEKWLSQYQAAYPEFSQSP